MRGMVTDAQVRRLMKLRKQKRTPEHPGPGHPGPDTRGGHGFGGQAAQVPVLDRVN